MTKVFYYDDLRKFFYTGFDAKIILDSEDYYLVRADAWTNKKPILYLYQQDFFDCDDDSLYLDWLNDILTDFGFNFIFTRGGLRRP